ncbi:MAG: hypothetical protein J6112_09720 [Clostridia bacterium]|nr:hypothetical protein [Clostridia bacterium]
MKSIIRTVLILMVLVLLFTSGCGVIGGPVTWKSGRRAGASVTETSKVIDSYTLQEGTAEEFTVANYYSDDMVVPRDRRIEIWGTAPESQNGKVVAAEFKGLKGSGVIKDGSFRFALQGTLPASKEKGHNIVVKGAPGVQEEFKDVIVGDIWIVSGQSNADLTFYGTLPQSTNDIKKLYKDYLAEATEEDDIRLLQQINWSLLNKAGVERMETPQDDVGKTTKWTVASRKKVYGTGSGNSFSMLGYFFAKELYKINPDVPIGIVMAACGGAPLALLASPDARQQFHANLKDRTITLNDIQLPSCGIYNAFIAPLTHVGITGMIFYQGESDALLSKEYTDALKTTVEDYRIQFGSDLLFLNVQLTTYGFESGGESLVGVWEAVPQMRFAQAEVKIDNSIRNYEIIPTIDVGFIKGDADGAHPYYKYDIGLRGAKMAAAIVYGIGDIEEEGFPIPSKITYDKTEVVIEYSYTAGGLKTSDGREPQGFEVLLDGVWTLVFPVIEGNTVKIEAENAQGVRYAPNLRYMTKLDSVPRSKDMTMANLVSGNGNIAVPFSVEFSS